jgi:hypothetical protein
MGFAFYYLTSLIVIVAAVFALDFVSLCRDHPESEARVDLLSALAAWDGMWYGRIASAGYSYDPDRQSAVAFFPLYPLLAGGLSQATGMRTEWALLLASHGAMIGAFALLGAYVSRRCSQADEALPDYAVLAMGLFPTTFYFRMTYTESVFMMLMLIALVGMEHGWRPLWIACVIGLATASRSVGVALVPVFGLYLWQRMRDAGHSPGSEMWGLPIPRWLAWAARVAVLLPVCCWGLLAYTWFLWLAFDEPLAFAKTQRYWDERPVTVSDRVGGLFTLEPFRAVYDAGTECYWGRVPPRENPLFNLKAANPVFFLATIGILGLGIWKRWLNSREVILAVGLLAIAYWFQANRACMTAQARYASVVFPAYLVLGHLLCRAPAPLSAALLAISAVGLGIYTMMFVSCYWFF